MAAGALFSGLVKGLGGSLGSAYQRQASQEYQTKQDEMHLAMSALMNDHDMPNSAKRLGMMKVFQIAGVKPPDGLIESIVPDYQVESGQYAAEEPMQMPDMPQAPADLHNMNYGQQQQQRPRSILSQMPTPPAMQGVDMPPSGQGFKSTGADSGSAPMFGMNVPRDPMTQHPTILPVDSGNGLSAAPVTQKYTGGIGSNIDELDQEIASRIAQLRHGKPIMKSSLDMSPQQINDARSSRLKDEDQLRGIQENQIQQAAAQRRQLQTFGIENEAQLGMIPREISAKISSAEQVLGRSLTSDEKAKMLGLNPSGPELERNLEAKDIEDSQNSELPPATRQAAQQRVLQRHLEIEGKIAQIRNINSETVKRMKDSNGGADLTPGQLNMVIKRAKMQAGGEWGQAEQDQYRSERTQYWSQWFDQAKQGTQFAGADAELQQMLSSIEKNPQAKANAIAQRVESDVKSYQNNLGEAIANAQVQNPGKLIYTIHAVRRAAALAKSQGKDPNLIWDAMKSNPNVIILGDDMQPWQQ